MTKLVSPVVGANSPRGAAWTPGDWRWHIGRLTPDEARQLAGALLDAAGGVRT